MKENFGFILPPSIFSFEGALLLLKWQLIKDQGYNNKFNRNYPRYLLIQTSCFYKLGHWGLE